MIATSASRRATIREVTLINAHSIKGNSAPSHVEYIDISSVGTGEFTEPPALMSFEEAPSRARRIVKAGDTILSTVRPNRRSFLFLSSPSSIAVASTGFAVLTPTPAVDPRYLYYWVTRQDFTDYLSLHAKGAAYPAVSAEDIGNGAIDLPPLPIQRRIAGILSAYDELIENSQRRIKILEEMARAIYREWFVEFRFPGHESVPRAPSPLGEIPKGWEVRSLKETATVTYGFPFASKMFNTDRKGVPIIRIRDILDGSTSTFTQEEAEAKYHIKDGHILIGMDGDFHMCIWSSGHALQNQRVARFETKGEISNFHLFLALEEPIKQLNKAIVGTTVAHLGDMHIKAIQLIWPSAALRVKALNVFESMSEQIILLKKRVQKLLCTRDLLLPRLLSGEIALEA